MCDRCGGKLGAIPAIDISQLARLDELTGAPGAGAAAQRQTARDPFAAPTADPAPADRFAPPPGAFGPGAGQDEQELAVERSTRAIRIANQRRREPVAPRVDRPAAPPSPRPPAPAGIAAAGVQVRGMVLVIGLVLVIAIVVVAIVSHR